MTVTNSGQNYLFDTFPGNNPALTFLADDIVVFYLNLSSHPFHLLQNDGFQFSEIDSGLTFADPQGIKSTGSAALGKLQGTLTWRALVATGVYYYRCFNLAFMTNTILLAPAVTIVNYPVNVRVAHNPFFAPSTSYDDFNSSLYTETYYSAGSTPGYGLVTWPNLKVQCANNQDCFCVSTHFASLNVTSELCSLPSTAGPSNTQSLVCPGKYAVTYGASDAVGNTVYCTFLLLVIDTTKPVFSCLTMPTMPLDSVSLLSTYATNCQSNNGLGSEAAG